MVGGSEDGVCACVRVVCMRMCACVCVCVCVCVDYHNAEHLVILTITNA